MILKSRSRLKVSSLSIEPLDVQSFLKDLSDLHDRRSEGAERFKWDYLLSECLSKYSDALPGHECNDSATRYSLCKDKFLAYNDRCAAVNDNGLAVRDTILYRAKSIVAHILGPFTFKVFSSSRFTSGATSDFRRIEGDPYFKYRKGEFDVTPSALKYALAFRRMDQRYYTSNMFSDAKFNVVSGGRFSTVPKNAIIDRPIVPQPSFNAFLQRGVGLYIRNRLFLHGVDLRDQSRNRELARRGSIDGSLATLDLSGASDSISDRVVWELLPPEWYEVLNDLRPFLVKVDDEWVYQHTFSSMGNGYTFELESLLFYALVKATCEIENNHDTVSVYGDDIICPSPCAKAVVDTLEGCGFTINNDKSFIEGPFRESCGGHYYHGVDVTPFYIRKPIDSLPRMIWLLNRLRLWSSTSSGICDPRIGQIWLKLRRKYVPPALLGGDDLESLECVASPEKPRKRLVPFFSRKKVGGLPWLYRWFQQVGPDGDVIDLRIIDAPVGANLVGTLAGYRVRTQTDTDLLSKYASLPLFPHECG